MSFSIGSFEVTGPVLVLGAITGMTYGILAVGLVLVYRSNRIINFAHGEIGAFAAAVLGLAVVPLARALLGRASRSRWPSPAAWARPARSSSSAGCATPRR